MNSLLPEHYMLHITEFGNVRVHVADADLVDTVSRVEINWSAIGSVPLSRARKFELDLANALRFAELERARLGIVKDK